MLERRVGRLLPIVVVVGLGACAKEPTEQVNTAYQAQAAAQAAGADQYASDAMNRVMRLRSELETELKAQGEHLALTRRYGRAAALADSLKLMSDAATSSAAAGREKVRAQVDTLLASAQQTLTQASGELAVAPVGKGSATDIAALRGDLDGVAQTLKDAQAAYEAGDFRAALTKVTAANEVLTKVQQSIQQARQMTRAS